MTVRTTIGLVDQRARKEEYFTIEQDKLAVFNPKQVQTVGQIRKLAPTDETDYKVMRAALRFFSEAAIGFTPNDLLVQLAAGHKYSPELKERTKETLAKRMTGTLELDELEFIASAIQEYEAISLKPFLVCNLLHCKASVLDECEIDPDMIALVKELRAINENDDESDNEYTRYQIQTVINNRALEILQITHRYDNVSNPAESIHLSNLAGCLEHVEHHFRIYLNQEQVPSFTDVVFGFKENDSLVEIARQLKESRRILKTLREIRPEVLSETSAQAKIEENEKVIQKSLQELVKVIVGTDKPVAFTATSFSLCPGVELGYLQQKSVLWISEEKFDSIDMGLIQNIVHILKVEKLAIGNQLFPHDPMMEYYSYKANRT